MTPNRHICLHSHFYQPPRENPWLEAIEYQESAYPYHDWNERISAECYRPNGLSRILDEEGWVSRFVNNYAKISFNFGPTLLSWMENYDPIAYAAILEGDRLGQQQFSGHGPAIAQAYNHVIMPLANRRDKETQVKWGLRDFEKRFGREAEALWLPETAVDMETLGVLADYGMRYVILAPRQAQSVRSLRKDEAWHTIENEEVDPKTPYLVNLPGGKSIAAFFYDGALSKAVAFEGLLHNGEGFADRLMDGYTETDDAQLLHIATDGESYGHHHRHGDMALAYALDFIEQNNLAEITVYGRYLDDHPPQFEARIHDNSSWSCVHGVERWFRDCGCNSGMHQGWNQKWRTPIRLGFDMLRDQLAGPFEDFMAQYTDDPWAMRDEYINIIHDRSEKNRAAFLKKWTKKELDTSAQEQIFKALEVQRNLLLVFTSCAWFFDEVTGIETVQNLQYAARLIDLAKDVLEVDLEGDFLDIIENAPSNISEFENGRVAYEKLAKPAKVGFLKLAAHLGAGLAISDEADEYENSRFCCFDYHMHDYQKRQFGAVQIICADINIQSRITQEQQRLDFCVIHLGDHNLNIGVRTHQGEDDYMRLTREMMETLETGDVTDSVRMLDSYFPDNMYSLRDLFKDQQKNIIQAVLNNTLENVEGQFINIYDQYHPVMHYLSQINIALPPIFKHIARYVQNARIEHELAQDEINAETIRNTVAEAMEWDVEFDETEIEKTYIEAFERLFEAYCEEPENLDYLQRLNTLLQTLVYVPFEMESGDMQNQFYHWYQKARKEPFAQDPQWQELTGNIAYMLQIRLPRQPAKEHT